MMSEVRLWIGDALVLASLLFTTVAVLGIVRMPDINNRVHAASQALLLGVLPLTIAAMMEAGGAVAPKIVALAVFLLLTGPVSSHVIVKAAADRGAGGSDDDQP